MLISPSRADSRAAQGAPHSAREAQIRRLRDGEPGRLVEPTRPGTSEAENAAGLLAPVAMYPLFEHAVRGRAGTGRDEHLARIAALWARCSEVAEANPHAWDPRRRAAEEIATASQDNRIVSDPYRKLLNAQIQVDQAAALILCSAGAAEAAGIPRERWVFVHAGADAHDHWLVSEREALGESPALRAAGRAALRGAGAGIDDVAHLDLYSCFPSAVEVAGAELGVDPWDPSRAPTVTGGLTFAGGPGNGYVTHAIATLADRLRADPGALGLVTGLGWYLTKHSVGVYGARPPAGGFARADLRDTAHGQKRAAMASDEAGEGTVESYTAVYGRDGAPSHGIVAALGADGSRAIRGSGAPEALAWLTGDEDPIGRRVALDAAGGFVPSG